MGDMGADVIKIERPGVGDPTRLVDRVFTPGMSSYFVGVNRSKRSVAINLRKAAGRDLAATLARSADVIVENFRPGVMHKLGLDYEDLKADNPRLVYCSISSFGQSGPLRAKAGMDLVVQAMGGVMGLTGEPERTPVRVGSPIADYVGAFQAVIGTLLALLARHASGRGQRVDVALLDGQVALLANYLPGFIVTGKPDRPVGVAHPQIVPYQLFKASDGELVIACLTDAFWRGLCRQLKLDGLIGDPRFRTNVDRVQHREDLLAILEPVVATWRVDELSRALDEADVPSAPVHSLADVVGHAQVRHNEMVVSLEQRTIGTYQAAGVMVKLAETPGSITRAAPELGEHTTEVLLEAGITPSMIAELSTQGVFGEGGASGETVDVR
jgi:crotonobetainyl-CoA:carnitine CoA-transferase CaiB-like acyl-CoA transferase